MGGQLSTLRPEQNRFEGRNESLYAKCGISIFEIGLSKISNFENLNNRDM